MRVKADSVEKVLEDIEKRDSLGSDPNFRKIDHKDYRGDGIEDHLEEEQTAPMIKYRERVEKEEKEGSPDKERHPLWCNCPYLQDPSNLQRINCEDNNEDNRENSSNFEQVSRYRVLRVIILENDAMRDLVFLEIAKIDPQDPDIEDKNTDPPPQSEILIENCICIESHRRSGQDNADEDDHRYHCADQQADEQGFFGFDVVLLCQFPQLVPVLFFRFLADTEVETFDLPTQLMAFFHRQYPLNLRLRSRKNISRIQLMLSQHTSLSLQIRLHHPRKIKSLNKKKLNIRYKLSINPMISFLIHNKIGLPAQMEIIFDLLILVLYELSVQIDVLCVGLVKFLVGVLACLCEIFMVLFQSLEFVLRELGYRRGDGLLGSGLKICAIVQQILQLKSLSDCISDRLDQQLQVLIIEIARPPLGYRLHPESLSVSHCLTSRDKVIS